MIHLVVHTIQQDVRHMRHMSLVVTLHIHPGVRMHVQCTDVLTNNTTVLNKNMHALAMFRV